MMEDRFLKRLRKKARKGLRGWPIATVAFYGPNLSQATKVTVGIVPSENADVTRWRRTGWLGYANSGIRARKMYLRYRDNPRRLGQNVPAETIRI